MATSTTIEASTVAGERTTLVKMTADDKCDERDEDFDFCDNWHPKEQHQTEHDGQNGRNEKTTKMKTRTDDRDDGMISYIDICCLWFFCTTLLILILINFNLGLWLR